MDTDTILVMGIILGAVTIPGLLNSMSESRSPRVPVLMMLISAALIVYAVQGNTSGYKPSDLPDVFSRVFKRLLN